MSVHGNELSLVESNRNHSLLSVVQVEQDGSFKFVDMSNRGGRAFFGLGSLLTGYKVKVHGDVTIFVVRCIAVLVNYFLKTSVKCLNQFSRSTFNTISY